MILRAPGQFDIVVQSNFLRQLMGLPPLRDAILG